jgi:hypothetical protein
MDEKWKDLLAREYETEPVITDAPAPRAEPAKPADWRDSKPAQRVKGDEKYGYGLQ